jgi:hypothetical protein
MGARTIVNGIIIANMDAKSWKTQGATMLGAKHGTPKGKHTGRIIIQVEADTSDNSWMM